MKCNLAAWDRILRFLIGGFMTTWAIAGGPSWAYIGIYGLASGSWGLCLVYSFFKISTLSEKQTSNYKNLPPV